MAGAVGGVIIAGSMKSLSLSLQSAQVVKSSLSESDLRHSIGQVLNNSADCLANFKPTGATAPSDPEQASSIGLYGADREWGVGQIVRLVKTQGNTDNSDDTALLKKGVAFKGDLTIVKMELKGALPSPKDGTTKLTKQTAFRSFLVYYKKERMGAYSTLGGKDCTDTDQSGCYFNQCQIEYRQDDSTTTGADESSCSVSDCVNYGSGGSGGTVACYEVDETDGSEKGRTLVGCGGTNLAEGGQITAFGYGAGKSNTTGKHNTFIGYQAGSSNIGGDENTISEGFYNTFVGSQAGEDNTTGRGNTFVGYTAGSNNTTSWDNTFVGTSAGSNSTGGRNTFLGSGAGGANTSGGSNTFVGFYAGLVNTTGVRNTFVGAETGYSGRNTGNDNTFLGYGAGYRNTTGRNNIFIGPSSGYQNTTGYNNTFIGYEAGKQNIGDKTTTTTEVEGAGNTFLGYHAGKLNTYGSTNVFVGVGAGYSNTTGKYNTFIGPYTGYRNTTGSHNTFIGLDVGLKSGLTNLQDTTIISNRILMKRNTANISTANHNISNKDHVRVLGALHTCATNGTGCKPVVRSDFQCSDGYYLKGIYSDGSKICRALPTIPTIPTTPQLGTTCPTGQFLRGFNSNGSLNCQAPSITYYSNFSNNQNFGRHNFCALSRMDVTGNCKGTKFYCRVLQGSNGTWKGERRWAEGHCNNGICNAVCFN